MSVLRGDPHSASGVVAGQTRGRGRGCRGRAGARGGRLGLAAVGWGCRRIAERLGRPVTTVRGWLRRWSRSAGRTAAVFTAWLGALADDPAAVLPAPAGTAVADAVCAVTGFVFAVRARSGKLKVPTWLLVSAACHGRLLAPGWPPA
ncbi:MULTISPECIES: helix-turn-helix domain-containing protein [Streptomyces]|uniref:helix-turn-helix domain-containing protein n=1 Tax=Streptomyces TaxID=1883 RepID=UPI0033B3253A